MSKIRVLKPAERVSLILNIFNKIPGVYFHSDNTFPDSIDIIRRNEGWFVTIDLRAKSVMFAVTKNHFLCDGTDTVDTQPGQKMTQSLQEFLNKEELPSDIRKSLLFKIDLVELFDN